MKKTKLAYFLRGLGFGIVFVTAVMTVSIKKSAQKTVVKTKEMSKEEIIAKAKEYGMTEGVEMKVDQLFDATAMPEPTTIPEQNATPSTNTPTESKAQDESTQSKGEKSFTIKEGQTAGQVAKALEEAGLVDDREKFHKYIEENGYSTKLIAREHMVKLNATYEEIANTLCKR